MVNKRALNPSRAIYYGALSKLLVFKNNDDRFFALKEALPILAKNALDENSKEAFERLYIAFDLYGEEIFQKEFDAVFYLPGNKTVRTTASYFEDGIEGGKKQLEVKNFFSKNKN